MSVFLFIGYIMESLTGDVGDGVSLLFKDIGRWLGGKEKIVLFFIDKKEKITYIIYNS